MRHLILLGLLICAVGITGCESRWGSAGLGAAGGTVATGGGYEYHAKTEMDRIEEEYEDGNMSKEEYEIRKDQIERMTIF